MASSPAAPFPESLQNLGEFSGDRKLALGPSRDGHNRTMRIQGRALPRCWHILGFVWGCSARQGGIHRLSLPPDFPEPIHFKLIGNPLNPGSPNSRNSNMFPVCILHCLLAYSKHPAGSLPFFIWIHLSKLLLGYQFISQIFTSFREILIPSSRPWSFEPHK